MDLSKNIIARLGLQDWPEEKRLKLVESLVALVEKRVMLRLMERMNDEDLTQAESLAGEPEKLLAFLSEKNPDMMQLFDEEIKRVGDEVVDASGAEKA